MSVEPIYLKQKSEDTPINPSHYKKGDIECIDAVEVAISNLKGPEANSTANVIKYMWRWKDKNGVIDLKKARWHIERLIDKIENK